MESIVSFKKFRISLVKQTLKNILYVTISYSYSYLEKGHRGEKNDKTIFHGRLNFDRIYSDSSKMQGYNKRIFCENIITVSKVIFGQTKRER